MLHWRQTKDGAKGRNPPDPVSPLSRRKKEEGKRRIGQTELAPDEAIALLSRYGTAAAMADAEGAGGDE